MHRFSIMSLSAILCPPNIMFIETQWLEENLDNPNIRIVELSYMRCLSNDDKVGEECLEEYNEGHIPGAISIDAFKDLIDTSVKDVFYVAGPDQITDVMNRAGISNDTLVVCYDEGPYPLAAARLWWTLLYYDYKNVKILQGGIRKWRMEGRPLSNTAPDIAPGNFTPELNSTVRATKEEVKRALNDKESFIIDCLPFKTYQGKVLNSWSIRKGHIPGALWIPPMELFKGLTHDSVPNELKECLANDKPYPFLPIDDLRKVFAKAGISDDSKRVIAYCGKADAASTVAVALRLIGFENIAVYDGSLAEWSRDPGLPMETGDDV